MVTVPLELQLLDDPGGEQAHHVRSRGHLEPRPHLFGHGGAAEQVPAFEDERLQASPAEIRRAHQPVVPSPDDDYVVIPRIRHHATPSTPGRKSSKYGTLQQTPRGWASHDACCSGISRSGTGPFGRSSTLPSEAYTSELVFRWELDRFFDRTWVCIGRTEDLQTPGDQRAVTLGLESALLTRDEDGGLHAFYNVCRHRGHELVETGCGTNQKFIRCPYHAWAYGLDGVLAGAPGFGKLAGFDRDGYSLVPLSIVEWHGWLFANASGDAPAFGEHIGNLGELIENHRPEELITTARHDYDVAANGKVITENYHECY